MHPPQRMDDSNSPPQMADLYPPQQVETEGEEWPHVLDLNHFYKVNSLIRQEKAYELLQLVMDNDQKLPANLMGDPVLNVVIACKKTRLAINLIRNMHHTERLMHKNCYGDTALHVAATVDDVQVAEELLRQNPDLAYITNTKMQTALHTAALNGHENIFWFLVRMVNEATVKARATDGATVLHYAIMGNAPGLALEIARMYKDLITSRTDMHVTPLQLMVTIPDLFRSQTALGRLESFLYPWIPVEDEHNEPKGSDEESAPASSEIGVGGTEDGEKAVDIVEIERTDHRSAWHSFLQAVVAWIILCVLKILMPVSSTLQHLENRKRRHKQALQLVGFMAAQTGAFDFFRKGFTGPARTTSFSPPPEMDSKEMPIARHLAGRGPETASRDMLIALALSQHLKYSGLEAASARYRKQITRWHESPLITGTRLGLHDFVEKILCFQPQSATYLDYDGRNVLQAAIQCGRKEIVKTICKMTSGNNPVLPSWLRSHVDKETRNTILHLAADKLEITKGDAVIQLQDEIKWFEMVKNILPYELLNHRNNQEKTAQELFTENHEGMLDGCKTQVIQTGQACSALVAAVVFVPSFLITGEKDQNTANLFYLDRLALKIYSHAYVIGFGCYVTSLLLFLSLVITPYKLSDFRRAVPMTYLCACLSFAMALLAFLISFTCNFYVHIYGGQRTEKKDLIPLVLEVTVFPAVLLIVLLSNGAKFGPSLSRLWATV